MKANELRVGSWIIDYKADPEKSIYWQVEAIEFRGETLGVTFRNRSCWTCLDAIEPIPLTLEWVLKFGFERVERRKGFHLKYLRVAGANDWKGQMCWIIRRTWGADVLKGNIKYVHQFQNVYHSLTGEELTLKKDA